MPELIEEDDISVNKGDININISKSFVNIESMIYRHSKRLQSKNQDKIGYYIFVPELDFTVTNLIVYHSKINNETYTF